MTSLPNASGIYKITCTVTGKIYIGSSVNIRKRWNAHRSYLNRNVHPNPSLQNAWNKYGEFGFIFELLEEVQPEELITREQYWLDMLKPYVDNGGFNVALYASAPSKGMVVSQETRGKLRLVHLGKPKSAEAVRKLSNARQGMKLSDETRRKISESKKGTQVSPETKDKLSRIRKGKTLPRESIEKARKTRERECYITSPNGETWQLKGLKEFCKNHSLNYVVMCRVASGKQDSHKGWKCRYVE